MARPKRIKIYLNGSEVGTGILSEDGKNVENVRFHPDIPEKDRERLMHDRELKVQERRRNNA